MLKGVLSTIKSEIIKIDFRISGQCFGAILFVLQFQIL